VAFERRDFLEIRSSEFIFYKKIGEKKKRGKDIGGG
jgi:hypothetical protein